jgi:hypothetical protein
MIHLAPRQTTTDLLDSFHASFGKNIKNIPQDTISLFDNIELNSRIIDGIRATLLSDYCEKDNQKKNCAEILGEIFADFTLAMYLLGIGLIVPARMSARRAFELGLASVYMWDLPHEYWGWKTHDTDLSFSTMVTHLNSVGYLAYLAKIHERPTEVICEKTDFQRIYRELSNTVHGKSEGLPKLSPERFTAEKNDIAKHLQLAKEAQDTIINLFYGRFFKLKEKMETSFPQTGRQIL